MNPELYAIYSDPVKREVYKRTLFEQLGHEPHGGQELFHYRSWQYHVGVWGRRGGKTQGAAFEIIEEASWPGRCIWIAAPTYVLTDKVFRVVYKAIVEDEVLGSRKGLKSYYNPKGDRLIELPGGGFIEGKTCENPKGLLGEGLDLLVIDEAAQISREIWETYLEPTLADRKGRCLFITTPRGYNWIYDLWCEGMSTIGQEEGWASSKFLTADNPYLDPDFIEQKRRRTDPATFRQEYEASFEAKKGVVYSDYSDHFKHKGGNCFSNDPDNESYIYIEDGWTHFRSIDPGLANPTAVLWGAVDPHNNVYIYDEYELSGALVKDHCEIIASKTSYPVLTTYIDPSAARRDLESGNSVQDNYSRYGIYTIKAANDIPYGIQKVSEYFRSAKEDSSNHPGVFICYEKCPTLRKCLVQYEWDEFRSVVVEQNSPDRPRKYKDHLPDALRYMLGMNPRYVAPHILRPGSLDMPVKEPDPQRWDGRPTVGQ